MQMLSYSVVVKHKAINTLKLHTTIA